MGRKHEGAEGPPFTFQACQAPPELELPSWPLATTGVSKYSSVQTLPSGLTFHAWSSRAGDRGWSGRRRCASLPARSSREEYRDIEMLPEQEDAHSVECDSRRPHQYPPPRQSVSQRRVDPHGKREAAHSEQAVLVCVRAAGSDCGSFVKCLLGAF